MVYNATFNNIAVITGRSVLLVEETTDLQLKAVIVEILFTFVFREYIIQFNPYYCYMYTYITNTFVLYM
jgi:hypothetical protein